MRFLWPQNKIKIEFSFMFSVLRVKAFFKMIWFRLIPCWFIFNFQIWIFNSVIQKYYHTVLYWYCSSRSECLIQSDSILTVARGCTDADFYFMHATRTGRYTTHAFCLLVFYSVRYSVNQQTTRTNSREWFYNYKSDSPIFALKHQCSKLIFVRQSIMTYSHYPFY